MLAILLLLISIALAIAAGAMHGWPARLGWWSLACLGGALLVDRASELL